MTHFKNLELNEKILAALEKKGYTTPTDIQRQAIPHILEGRDLFGIAQTGTGKTAAFSLPLLHNLAKNPVSVKSGGIRALILTPTRELASQIADNIELYGKELGLRYAVMFGGVSEKPQIAATQGGVDILIATPGRLLDLTNQGYIRYMQLEVLILDEADRMLDMGFINDVKKIISKIPSKRQTLFFSATMPASILGLADSILTNPVKVEVTPQATTVEKIEQTVLMVDKSHKLSLLKKILKDQEVTSALVFCRTKHGSNKVVEFLVRNAVSVAAIHGNKSQGAREKALGDFRAGKIKVLVATDIAARGIDIPAISHIFNYDIPTDPESYVHRIGRTARAGLKGIAMSFCDPSETKYLHDIEKTIKQKIAVDTTHAFHNAEAAPQSSYSKEPRDYNRRGGNDRRHSGGNGREPRKYGFAVNKERRVNESNDKRNYNSAEKNEQKPKKKILGFFGFGKKSAEPENKRNFEDRRPRNSGGRYDNKRPRGDSDFRNDRRPRDVADFRDTRKPRDFGSAPKNEDGKKRSFGFGWFKSKKSEGGDSSSRSIGGYSDNKRRPEGGFKKPYAKKSGFGNRRSDSFNNRRKPV